MNGLTIIQGDCREVLKTLPSNSVNCTVTSPPYWNLRDYGADGQIGVEATPDAFVAQMVAIFRDVWRVLKDDGTLWLNLGDSYASCGKDRTVEQATAKSGLSGGLDSQCAALKQRSKVVGGLKPKDLCGIPWRVAFALQADGWWLRGDHVWAKPNGMPESVQDRPSRSHEYVFLLTKSERYWYDSEAVRTAPKPSTITRLAQDVDSQAGSVRANGGEKTNGTMKTVARKSDKQRGHTRRHAGFNDRWDAMKREEQMAGGANLRSVWWIPTAQCKDAHFAVMPERVAEICIRAGCPEGGVVLEPFAGSGTVPYVARNLRRECVAIELNPEYVKLIKKRNAQQVIL